MIYESRDYFRLAKQLPQLVGGVTLFLLAWDLVVGLWKSGKKTDEADEPQPDSASNTFKIKRWLALGISLAVYVLLLPAVGFVIMTTLLILSLLWFFNVRQPVTMIAYTGATVGVIYGVFAKLLYVPLPAGTLW